MGAQHQNLQSPCAPDCPTCVTHPPKPWVGLGAAPGGMTMRCSSSKPWICFLGAPQESRRIQSNCNCHALLPTTSLIFRAWRAVIGCVQVEHGLNIGGIPLERIGIASERIRIALNTIYFAPAGRLRRKSLLCPDIQKVESLYSWNLDLSSRIFLSSISSHSSATLFCKKSWLHYGFHIRIDVLTLYDAPNIFVYDKQICLS